MWSTFKLKHSKINDIQVFDVPRKPFSQASMKNDNSVFTRKYWNSNRFATVHQVGIRLE